jgi:hypothetical protein
MRLVESGADFFPVIYCLGLMAAFSFGVIITAYYYNVRYYPLLKFGKSAEIERKYQESQEKEKELQ